LTDQHVREASLVAFYLPMHTANRLAGSLIARTRRLNPGATLAAYGLYAPLNRAWLEGQGVEHVSALRRGGAGGSCHVVVRTLEPSDPRTFETLETSIPTLEPSNL
jgi:hypothetical protein